MESKRQSFLHTLHPISLLSYLLLVLMLTLIYNHPLYIATLLILIIWLNFCVDKAQQFLSYLRLAIPVLVLTIVINLVMNQQGTTFIVCFSKLPLLGSLQFSWEALLYGTVMTGKMIIILAVFSVLSQDFDPDRSMLLLNRTASKTALLVSLSLRMIPRLSQEMGSIMEVFRIRGLDFDTGLRREKIRKRFFLVKALLITSLESSWDTAESLQARAFGAGPRTRYQPEMFRPRDFIVCIGSSVALLASVVLLLGKKGFYTFYPQIGPLFNNAAPLGSQFLLILGLVVPILLEVGHQKWSYMSSKI